MLRRAGMTLMLAIAGAWLAFPNAARSGAVRVDRNRIEGCSDTPNCVSSRSKDSAHYVSPLQLKVTSDKAWEALKSVVASEGRTSIVEEVRGDGYLRAEAVSLIFRFVDDVEFQILPEDHLIHLRSASRVGYWDLGVNLRRVERIGDRLREAGIVK